jgi:hypothetical protein
VRLDGEARQVRLLVDHREDLIGERTRQICRLRWHVHELDPVWDRGSIPIITSISGSSCSVGNPRRAPLIRRTGTSLL